jgi:hypothetical protein
MDKRWPLHPKPGEYQLLYCWIKEISETYKVSYKSFCRNALKLTEKEISELRRELPEKALIILSKGTGVPIWDLRKRDLHGIFRKIELDLEKMIKENPEPFNKYLDKFFYKS